LTREDGDAKRKDLGHSLGRDLGSQALEIAQRRQAAARQVLELLQSQFGASPSHPETVLYAAAWLAGTSLYRSMGIHPDIEPGTPVLSDQANEHGPKLLTIFSTLVEKFGLALKQDDLVFKVPAEHKSEMGILEVQDRIQVPYNEIMRKHKFDYLEGAKTGAVACAFLVKIFCIDTHRLPAGLAAGIVSMGFVEGSKTAPTPLPA
jgi:hypothetical protein